MVLASQFRRACAVGSFGAAIASVGIFCLSPGWTLSGGDAHAILKAPTDGVFGPQSKAAAFTSGIEVIRPELQKNQLDRSGRLRLNDPDKTHASRTVGDQS